MIKIINVTKDDSNIYGENDYEVWINTRLLTSFKHFRKEGLAMCLRKAADAVDNMKTQEDLNKLKVIYEMFQGIDKGVK
ncbi:hypothetical protein M0R01_04885 [bacterium]|jgi:hypothetical protein|nr:hypothetical protein [bacterium]